MDNYPLSNNINISYNNQISNDINTPYTPYNSKCNDMTASNNLISLNSIIFDDESCCCKCCNRKIILKDPNNITFKQNGLCFMIFLFIFSSIFPLMFLSYFFLNPFEEDSSIALFLGLFFLLIPLILGTLPECYVHIKLDNNSLIIIKRRLLYKKTKIYYKGEVSYIRIRPSSGEERGYEYNIDLITSWKNEDIFFFESNKKISELNGISYIIDLINKHIETNMRF